MTHVDPHTKPCHYCGQPVNVSSYRCPHCDRSLAAAEQQNWEQSDPSAESFEESHEERGPSSGIQISPAFIVLFVLAVTALVYAVFLRLSDKNDELPAVFSTPARKPPVSAAEKKQPDVTSYIRIHETADSPAKDEVAPHTESARPLNAAREDARQAKIGLVSNQILEKLRQEHAEKPDTVRLTSGREIECEVVGESDSQVTIKLGGLTATIDRTTVESIEHQSNEAAEKEMEKTALAKATQVVDQGLVQYGDEWIPPEEKARRESRSQTRKETKAAEIPEAEQPEPTAVKPAPVVQREMTNKEKLDSLVALARERGTVDADFFGGILHIEDRSDEWPSSDDSASSIIAFKGQAEKIDIAQLCAFLKLDIKPTGFCDAEIDGGVDTRKPKTLEGETHITGTNMTIPPIDLSPLVSPLNKNVALNLNLLAEDGRILIQGLQLVGSAYDVAGSGVVRIADTPEQSPINATFTITLKEPPTLTDTGAAGSSMQYILSSMMRPGKEIDVTLSGPISDPAVQLSTDSAIGSIAYQIKK